MTAAPARLVRALSIHADYRCGNTGVCCSSGWDIPVEPDSAERIRAGLRSGGLTRRRPDDTLRPTVGREEEEGEADWFRPVPGLPHGARVVLRTDAHGRCVFLEARTGRSGLCAVHHRLGERALPSACRQFPRVVTLTPLGASVTLSHYCPTASSMLFAPTPTDAGGRPSTTDHALRIVEDPPAFPPSWPYEGLDARKALPPLLRPGVLMDWPGLLRWERFAVGVLAHEARSPEVALAVLSAAAEDARVWTPDHGGFGPFLEQALAASCRGEASSPGDLVESRDAGSTASAWPLVAACVPKRSLLPAGRRGPGQADERWVAPSWPLLARPVRRWLAAKAFASWLVLQGEGLRTTVFGLRVALGVLRAEAACGCAESGRELDPDLLKEACRRADLLLLHLADPMALARRLSRCETAEGPAAAWSQTLDARP